MRHNKLGIKWKIFTYMLVFVLILLALLWFVQTVYLDQFYKSIKMSELNDAFEAVESIIDDEDIDEAIEYIGARYDVCILITNKYGNEIYSKEQNMECVIHRLRRDEISKLAAMAKANGNSYSVSGYEFMPGRANNIKKPPIRFENKFQNMPNITKTDSIISVRVMGRDDNLVIINSVITPVEATVHTLRIQLIYISIIMILLSLLIAIIISLKISKPIVKINESAKQLGDGNYNVYFDGGGYREIAQLSDTLNHTATELAKAEGIQRELIANVSHDLRTPLTMITAYSEVMRDLPGENTPENVQVIIEEATRLTNLVNDLLDVSKLQAGATQLELKEYDLTESIEAVLTRYSKLLEQDEYIIDFQYDRHVRVLADEFKIYQVIYNLVNNAINYTGEDKKVVVKQKLIDNNTVRIEVIDSGRGIDEKELENIWERYYKVDKNHKRAVMGTGLGLSIVKNILKLHNVNFGVNSENGMGTIFWFELKTLI